MSESLKAIETSLACLSRDILLQSFRPGVAPEEVRARLQCFGFGSLDDLESLLEWHDGLDCDGTVAMGDIWMIPGFYLMSLDEAAFEYEQIQGFHDDRWDPCWWPVFENSGGDFIVVALPPDGDGGVYYFFNEATEWPKIFESLADMMATVAAGFDQGIFIVSSDDGAICDRNLEDLLQLGAMMNPSVGCWTDGSAYR